MMNRFRAVESATWRFCGISLLVIVSPSLSHAQYLDPGSGSFVFQSVIAGLTIFLFFFSRIRQFLAEIMHRSFHKDPPE
jgi:hypothetical protein